MAARERTGNVFWSRGRLYARVRAAGKRHCLALGVEKPATQRAIDAAEAKGGERAALLSSFAVTLEASGNVAAIDRVLAEAATADDKRLALVRKLVEDAKDGKVRHMGSGPNVTFGEVAVEWTSGRLAARYPGHVRVKKTAEDDESMLERYVLPLLRRIPMRDFSIDHADQVMQALPRHLKPATRRHVAQVIHRIGNLAAYPMRIIKTSPLPVGFLPKVGDQPHQAVPYPDEADKFTSGEAPFGVRLFVGFLAREGMRHEEAASLNWGDVDLDRGFVKPTQNKTGDLGRRPLRADVVRALVAYRTRRGDPKPSAPLFVDDTGVRLKIDADELRALYLAAGIDRAELHQGSATETATGFHGLRGLFVTEARARDKSNAWIKRRTRHKTEAMISRYDDEAKSWMEQDLPPLGDLDVLLGLGAPPVGNGGPGVGSGNDDEEEAPTEKAGNPHGRRRSAPRRSALKSAAREGVRVRPPAGLPDCETRQTETDATQQEPPSAGPCLPNRLPIDPVEEALAMALTEATKAQRWDLVGELARQLDARRVAALNPGNVVRLDPERRRGRG